MSERERWIIYPLLFFSFTLAMRDQWPSTASPPNEFNVINCRHLVVKDAQGNTAVDIRAQQGQPGNGNAGSGVITVYGASPDGGTASAAAVRLYASAKQRGVRDNFGVVETLSPLGSRATLIAGDDAGGTMYTFDAVGKLRATLLPIRLARTPSGDDPRTATPKPPQP